MAQTITIKNSLSPSESVKSPKGIKPAKQEFKDDADLNSIMRKFQKSGSIDHAQIYQGTYGVASPHQLHEAMNLVTHADTMFNELPSSIRNKFKNNAVDFLEYVQNPANAEEAKSLGISLSTEAAAAAEKLAAEAAPQTPAPPVQTPETPASPETPAEQ